ncbi:MAG: hypothetical protein NW226_17070 [Microscillaceae bacterium]|nr:hypothetical protein [Microscillaceae bacterium]
MTLQQENQLSMYYVLQTFCQATLVRVYKLVPTIKRVTKIEN